MTSSAVLVSLLPREFRISVARTDSVVGRRRATLFHGFFPV
jgi:hypothetical protein